MKFLLFIVWFFGLEWSGREFDIYLNCCLMPTILLGLIKSKLIKSKVFKLSEKYYLDIIGILILWKKLQIRVQSLYSIFMPKKANIAKLLENSKRYHTAENSHYSSKKHSKHDQSNANRKK